MHLPRRARLRPVGFDEPVSLVAHLDELRTRIIVSLLALGVAFGLCFWQNHRLLELIDQPLAHQTQAQVRAGHGPLGATYTVQVSARDVAQQLQTVVGALQHSPHPPARPSVLSGVAHRLKRDVARLSAPPTGDRPITLGIGEPFTTTVTVSFVFALILALPVLGLEAYAYLAPAVDPELRGRVRPLLPAIPGLFVLGVAFGYFAVLPAAVRFFQNFNSARAGIVTTDRLRRSRRYALGACGLIAACLPGDAITMLLETVPIYLLFEASLLIARLADRRARRRSEAVAGLADPSAVI